MASPGTKSVESKQSAIVDYEPVQAGPGRRRKISRVTCRWSFVALLPALLVPPIVFGIDPVGHHMLHGWAFNDYILPIAGCASIAGLVLGIISAATGSAWGAAFAFANLVALFFLPSFGYA
jgi:hypothetical protein